MELPWGQMETSEPSRQRSGRRRPQTGTPKTEKQQRDRPPGDVQGQPWDSEVAAHGSPSLPLESNSGPGSPPRALSTLP